MATDHRVRAIGENIGNYRLVRLLGSGGFANVYLGEHQHLDTYAAIKVLQTKLANEQAEQFRKEARLLAHLIHPHIVRVLDFDVENMFPFLVMEYAPGGTLRQRHPKGSAVPLPTVVAYIRQVASALDYAHAQKLIHRDVKPENMLINQQDQIVLSDFGVASIAHNTKSQTLAEVAGTIAYISPEQIQGLPRTASDQYALGIVVYEWLSGERPFQGSFGEVASQQLLTSPQPVHGRIPGISQDVEDVLFTALAKDPRNRFATTQAFATALAQASKQGDAYPIATALNIDNPSMPSSQAVIGKETPLPAVPDVLPSVQSPHTPALPNELSIPSSPQLEFPASSFVDRASPVARPISRLITPLPGVQWASFMTSLASLRDSSRRNMLVVGGSIFLLILLIAGTTLFALAQTNAARQNATNLSTIKTRMISEEKTSLSSTVTAGVSRTISSQATATSIGATATAQSLAQAAQATLTASQTGTAIAQVQAQTAQATSAAIQTATAVKEQTQAAQATSAANQAATAQAAPAATAAARAAAIANASPQQLYSVVTSGSPALVDPLSGPDNNGWTNAGACTFKNGAYHDIVATPGTYVTCTAGTTNFCNMAYRVQMNILSGDGGGMIIRSTASNADRLRVGPNGTYDIVNASVALQPGATTTAIHTGYNVANVVTLIARGNNIYLYINQQYVMHVTDNSTSCGQIGLMSVDFSKSADTAFSNAEVWTF